MSQTPCKSTFNNSQFRSSQFCVLRVFDSPAHSRFPARSGKRKCACGRDLEELRSDHSLPSLEASFECHAGVCSWPCVSRLTSATVFRFRSFGLWGYSCKLCHAQARAGCGNHSREILGFNCGSAENAPACSWRVVLGPRLLPLHLLRHLAQFYHHCL